jgi:EF hand
MSAKRVLSHTRLAISVLSGVCWTAACQAVPPVDGRTSATERAAIEAAFTRADSNSDGKLSREESLRLPAIALRFDALDKNRDGFLSLEEFATGAMTE